MDQPSLQPMQTQPAQESYPSPPLPEYVSASDYHEGLKQIRAHLGRDCGFGITISRTKTYTPLKTGEKRVTRVALQCAKAKEYQSKGIGHKVYASRMTNCPWRAKMTPHPGGGWKVIPVVNDHNHPLTDPLNDRGLPPRARTTPAKGARTTVADAASPPTAVPYTVQPNFLPTMSAMSALSAWPTATPSGVKRTIMPMHQRVLLASRMPLPMNEAMLVVYNDKFNEMLGGQADLKMVLQDTFPFAHQAGVFYSKSDSVFVTSNLCDIPTSREKVVVISKLTRSTYGDWSRQQLPQELKMASGGVYYNDGILDGILFCSQGDLEHSSSLSQLETEYPFRIRTLLDNYHGRRFNSLKEVAIHSDGSIWFTDPVYGYDQGSRPPPELPNQVYRFDPNTGDVRVMADGFGRPSGICFSPKEKVCYISDTDFIHGNGNIDFTRASTIYAYDVEERNQAKFLTKKRVFAMADVGVPDGLKCDSAGNLYAACGDGLSVWSPGGVLLGKVLIPGGLANFCFGKKGEIYLLNGKKFWLLKMADTIKSATADREAGRNEEVIDIE